MPVLKILGGVGIGELLAYARENVPGELIPNVAININAPFQSIDPENATGEPALSSYNLAQLTSTRETPPGSLVSEPTNASSETRGTTPATSLSSHAEANDLSGMKPILQRSEAMSFGQSMFWFVTLLLEDKTTLNHTGSFWLRGNISHQ